MIVLIDMEVISMASAIARRRKIEAQANKDAFIFTIVELVGVRLFGRHVSRKKWKKMSVGGSKGRF